MNVDWVIACRYAEVNGGLATIAGAGIDTITVITVPVTVAINLAVRLQGLPEELGEQEHDVRNVVRGPDDEIIYDLSGRVAFGLAQDIPRPDWLQGLMLPMVVQFEVTGEGSYTFEHIVDTSSYSLPLHVVLAAPPPAE